MERLATRLELARPGGKSDIESLNPPMKLQSSPYVVQLQ